MIHPYAFVRPIERLPDVRGVDGAPIEYLRVGDVAVVFSRHDGGSTPDPRADAVAHGLVVEALAAIASSVAPVRFGESFADELRLVAAVEERLPVIAAALDRVAGCVEIGVRVAAPVRAAAVVATSGKEYLQERLAALRDHDVLMSGLHEHLETVSRAANVSSRGSFEADYLLERDQVAEAERHVRAFAAEHAELTVVCTGPWAPYSFAGAQA
jgi:hypothetical protein